jgi:hypothetical protein
VAESGLKVSLLEHSMGDLAALADYRATREDIASGFGVPLAFLTSETNLANLQAAEHQHLSKAIRPRQQEADLRWGVRTVNEVRQERGLPPVPWGDEPWLPLRWAPSSHPRRVSADS